MLHVRLAGLSIDSLAEQPVLLFVAADEATETPSRALPIWIGHPEATSILMALQGIETPRPMTHDLLRDVIDALGYSVERVEITKLEDGTFFANLVLASDDLEVVVDARPSDCIALSVRVGCPIYIDEAVFESAAVEITMATNEEEEVQRFRDFLDTVEPSDFQS